MPANRATAIDDMVAVLVPALDGIPTQWPNISDGDLDKSGVWARVTFVHGLSSRASLGARRENHVGTVYVQLFMQTGKGGEDIYSRPQPILDALTDCRTPNGVWFRHVSLYEDGAGSVSVGDSEAYYSVTVTAEFSYDEFRA